MRISWGLFICEPVHGDMHDGGRYYYQVQQTIEMMMRPDRRHKPDALVFLFLFVGLGMIATSIAHAENYLYGEPDVLSTVHGISASERTEFQSGLRSNPHNSWLLPGSGITRTSFRGGMAHLQFDSSDDDNVAAALPANTRFTLSMGLEENTLLGTSGTASYIDTQQWYDRYRPMLYFSIGHRW